MMDQPHSLTKSVGSRDREAIRDAVARRREFNDSPAGRELVELKNRVALLEGKQELIGADGTTVANGVVKGGGGKAAEANTESLLVQRNGVYRTIDVIVA